MVDAYNITYMHGSTMFHADITCDNATDELEVLRDSERLARAIRHEIPKKATIEEGQEFIGLRCPECRAWLESRPKLTDGGGEWQGRLHAPNYCYCCGQRLIKE